MMGQQEVRSSITARDVELNACYRRIADLEKALQPFAEYGLDYLHPANPLHQAVDRARELIEETEATP